METISEQTLIEQATSPSRLLELNMMFQLLYANRVQELMLEQQQRISSASMVTPPPSPSSSIPEDHLDDQVPIDLTYGGTNSSMTEQSSSPGEPRPAKQSSKPVGKRSAARRIRFDPYQMNRRPSHLSAVSVQDAVEVELMYHENMARQVRPTTDSTPEEKERRDQVAYAARVSRAKKRALQSLLQTEHDEAAQQNQSQKLFVAQKRVYLTELCHLLGMPQLDLIAEWENVRECYEE